MMDGLRRKKAVAIIAAALAVTFVAAGCGQQQQAAKPVPQVKAIEVKAQNVPIVMEFVGQIEAAQEVQVRARVSGQIIERLIPGGQPVKAGQALFRIDPASYEMSSLDAASQLAESQAALSQQKQNVSRLSRLVAVGAVSQQEYDNAIEQEKQLAARVNSSQAKLNKTNLDLKDTTIVAPISGRMDTSNMAVGNFVTSGSTVLTTISSVDPVMVRFSVSESEYLRFVKTHDRSTDKPVSENIEIVLEDGTVYAQKGSVTQFDRGLSAGTGTLTLKAQFPNSQNILMPGMFAKVRATAETRPDAILIPQRAVQDLMGKSMVAVIGEGDKIEMRVVQMGPRMGTMWLVESGLKAGERIVVDGVQNARQGQPVKPEMVDVSQYAQPQKTQ